VPEERGRTGAFRGDPGDRFAGRLVVEEKDGVDPPIAGELLERVLGRMRPEHLEGRRWIEPRGLVARDDQEVDHAAIIPSIAIPATGH